MAPSKPTPSATRQPPIVRDGNVVRVNSAARRPALAWAALGVVCVLWGSTPAAFSAYAYALAALPVSTVATYAYVNPVIAVLLGVLVAGERFSPARLVGSAVVLLVVIAAERPRKRQGELATSRM